MKLRSDITINGKVHHKGEPAPMAFIYPFFLLHMGMFGLSGFVMAYASEGIDVGFLYMHGGIAIVVYLVFYLAIFGLDELRWMFINSALGLFGLWAEIGTILSWFGKAIDDFPWYVHVVPFLYYILYTFLLRQLVLDLTRSREDPVRKRRVEILYVGVSLLVYGLLWFRP